MEEWEQIPGDGFPDGPSGDVLRRIFASARRSGDVSSVIDAYIIRSEWLREHPEDRLVLMSGNHLARMLENSGGKIEDLPDLMRKRQSGND